MGYKYCFKPHGLLQTIDYFSLSFFFSVEFSATCKPMSKQEFKPHLPSFPYWFRHGTVSVSLFLHKIILCIFSSIVTYKRGDGKSGGRKRTC